jgi:hypothetical protein
METASIVSEQSKLEKQVTGDYKIYTDFEVDLDIKPTEEETDVLGTILRGIGYEYTHAFEGIRVMKRENDGSILSYRYVRSEDKRAQHIPGMKTKIVFYTAKESSDLNEVVNNLLDTGSTVIVDPWLRKRGEKLYVFKKKGDTINIDKIDIIVNKIY